MRRLFLRLLACSALPACELLAPSVVQAQTVYQFELPAQSLADSLRAVGRQTSTNILFEPNVVKNVQAPALRAQLTIGEAISHLLGGTQLTSRQASSDTLIVESVGQDAGKTADKPSLTPSTSAVRGTNGYTRLAQAESTPNAALRGEQAGKVERTELEEIAVVPEILVVGSRILNMDIRRSRDDAQPYVVFDRGVIEQSGATNVEDFLKQRLPMNTQGISYSQDARGTTQGTRSQINLRGLGSGQTLILVDGRRRANVYFLGGAAQTDLNGIPLAAIERIEVLPSTASGIYGGSATGGVVNVVLRRDYVGAETQVTYGSTFDGGATNWRADFSAGFGLEGGRTNVLLAGNYLDQSQMGTNDRDFVQRGRQRILANNPAAILGAGTPPLGALTNIRSSNGANLTLDDGTSLDSPITTIPRGYAGAASDGGAALIANAGTYNLDLPATGQLGRQSLLIPSTIKSASVTVRREWTDSIQTFLEANVSENTSRAHGAALLIDNFTVPADAPTNPFMQNINVSVPSGSTDIDRVMKNSSRQAAAGVIAKLPGQWMGEIDYGWNRTSSSYSDNLWVPSAAAELSSGALDVLRDTSVYPLDYSSLLQPFNFTITPFRAELRDATLRLSGPTMRLPAGPITISGLFEHLRQEFDQASLFQVGTTFLYPSRSRKVSSAYVEARLPVFSERMNLPGARVLELQVAGRWDEYTTHGVTGFITNPAQPIVRTKNEISSVNPTLGLRYMPVRDIMIRASYGTGFLPPDINQLARSAPIVNANGGVLVDPKRGNEQAGAGGPVSTVSGGNPDLEPEDSKSSSAGIVFTPRFLASLRVSVDWTRIEKTGNIVSLGLQPVINNEDLLSGRVTRGPVPPNDPFGIGPITSVDNTLVNLARAEVEAYDVALDYTLSTAEWGNWTLFAGGTWQTHYKTQILPLPGQPLIENVGVTSNNPLKLKANAGLTWQVSDWALGWNGRYYHSYLASTNPVQQLSQGHDGRVPSQTYHDFFASYRFGENSVGLLQDTEFKLGITNAFNTRPPVDVTAAYFYSTLGDPRLASYYLSVKKQFR